MIRFLFFLRRHAWPIALVLTIGVGLLLGTLFYWYPLRGAKAETSALERRLADERGERASLQKLYEALREKFRKLESDRDNVLTQTKQLLAEKESYGVTDAKFKALGVENKKLLEDHKKLEESFAAVQTQAKNLAASLKSAEAAWDASKSEAARVTQENRVIISERDAVELKNRILVVEVERYKGFQESFLSLSRSFDTLKNEKKLLEKKLSDLPEKFSRMARENEILRKETGDMHYNLGVFYAGEMNYDRALEEFKKAVEIDPNDAKALYNLGYIYAEQRQDRKKAEYYFRLFLGLAPADPHVDEVKTYLLERDVFTTNVLKS